MAPIVKLNNGELAASIPWSNSIPKAEEAPVFLACLPSRLSKDYIKPVLIPFPKIKVD